MITAAKISSRDERPYVGIRFQTPFKGMFAEVDKGLKELRQWVKIQGIADEGPFFLRYHVIDMAGMMDLEVGFMVQNPPMGDDPVTAAVLPEGNYANLTYSRYAMRGNKVLIKWMEDNKVDVDRWTTKEGDVFACRYEAYLTDYRIEPRKTVWEVDLAIKLKDDT